MIRVGTIRDIHNTFSNIPVKERSSAITGLLININRIMLNDGPAKTYFVLLDLDSVHPRKAQARNEWLQEDVHLSMRSFKMCGVTHYTMLVE